MTTSESVGHSKTCSLWLQKSPSRNFWKMAEILSTFQRFFLQSGMWWFKSSKVSQPVRRSEKMSLVLAERPANGGLF
jgi:hypothetical protein